MPSTFQVNRRYAKQALRLLLTHFQITDVCVAPGSRSTPLTLAAADFEQQGDCRCHVHYEERGLGFFALGIAKASHKPVAVITTSGSAVANLLPAVIEAYYQGISLFLLTADRPLEHINVGANQAIEQAGVFGVYTPLDVMMPCPGDVTLESYLSQISDVTSENTKAPIHINFPFREPMFVSNEETEFIGQAQAEQTQAEQQKAEQKQIGQENTQSLAINTSNVQVSVNMQPGNVEQIAKLLQTEPLSRLMVIVGEATEEETEAALELATSVQAPALVNGLSKLRLALGPNIIQGFDHYIQHVSEDYYPDLIVWVGSRLVSQKMYKWIPDRAKVIQFQNTPSVINPEKKEVTWIKEPFSKAWASQLLNMLENSHAPNPNQQLFYKKWQAIEVACKTTLKSLRFSDKSEQKVMINSISSALGLSKIHGLSLGVFIGNSSPIRLFSNYFLSKADDIGHVLDVFGNRGCSGIDGNIATIAGIAKGLELQETYAGLPVREAASAKTAAELQEKNLEHQTGGVQRREKRMIQAQNESCRPWMLANIGDLTFLHDVSSLACLHQVNIPVVILVFNNQGGGIFSWLPIHESEHHHKFFHTPHQQSIGAICKGFGIDHSMAELDGISQAMEEAIARRSVTVIEVNTCSKETAEIIRQTSLKFNEGFVLK